MYRCVGGPLHGVVVPIVDTPDRPHDYTLEPGEDSVLRWVHDQTLHADDPGKRNHPVRVVEIEVAGIASNVGSMLADVHKSGDGTHLRETVALDLGFRLPTSKATSIAPGDAHGFAEKELEFVSRH